MQKYSVKVTIALNHLETDTYVYEDVTRVIDGDRYISIIRIKDEEFEEQIWLPHSKIISIKIKQKIQ